MKLLLLLFETGRYRGEWYSKAASARISEAHDRRPRLERRFLKFPKGQNIINGKSYKWGRREFVQDSRNILLGEGLQMFDREIHAGKYDSIKVKLVPAEDPDIMELCIPSPEISSGKVLHQLK